MNNPKVVGTRASRLTFVPVSSPCQGGSITYNFVEGSGAPNPGGVGATMTVNSPPASATTSWTTMLPADISSLQIIDSSLFNSGFTGAFSTTLIAIPITSTGPQLTAADLFDIPLSLEIKIDGSQTIFAPPRFPGPSSVAGTWSVSTSVPEPPSEVLAGITSTIGEALAAYRKRKEVRRQRPVGPLHANQ